MVTIVVEDGSIVPGANSYVSAADLTTYASNRGITLVGDPSILLIRAMDYIESLGYKGHKVSSAQPLQWPRYGVFIDSYYLDADYIPVELKNGLMQTAIAVDQGNDPLAVMTQGVKRERVDVIEIEYMDGSSSSPIIKQINAALYKLLGSGYGMGGGNVINVRKA